MYRIGIDVGGTNIAMGVVDESYRIIEKKSIKTSENSNPQEMIEAIAEGIWELIAGLSEAAENASEKDIKSYDLIETIGIGVPGTAELDTGKILYANNLGFEDVPFLTELKKVLGPELAEKTYFENDANAAAIGEYITGGYNVPVFVMVTLGTGIGGGMIINGKLLRGCNYAAAEFGHMSINIDGCDCNCGRKGCFEDYASATALVEQAKEALKSPEGKESLLWKDIETAEDLDGEKFFGAAKAGDAVAIDVLDGYCNYLAEGLTNLINILQPDVIVLSGGITRAADLFLDKVKEKVARDIYSRTSKVNTQITLARGISDSGDVGIIGAALVDKM
ncbi:MAG: ROK family protein [Butyrivibrio sp.]|nr:ROK family protein [Butyrivibrio sp.]